MKHICVVNINWLGDAVFSLPVFRALKSAYPQARICCCCVPRVADVLRCCPDIDEIIVLDEEGAHFWLWQKIALVFLLRRKNFDAALVLHPSLWRGMMVWAAGIPCRFGFSKWPSLMTRHVPHDPGGIHRMDHYLKVVEAAGITVTDRTGRLQAPNQTPRVKGRYLVFNTGGNWDKKRWPLGHWIELASKFNTGEITVVFSGSSNDVADAKAVIDGAGLKKAVNCCGQTSLGEALSIFRGAEAVISGDSGPLHLAAAVGAKTVAIFGPTRPEITGTRGQGQGSVIFHEIGCNKAPCYFEECRENVCMKGVSPDEVFAAYRRIISQ